MTLFTGMAIATVLQIAVAVGAGEIGSDFNGETTRVTGSARARELFAFPPPPEGAIDPYVYSYGHACLSDQVGFGDSQSCAAATAACREKPDGMLVNWYRQRVGGEQERLDSSCLYPGAPPERRGGGLVVAVTEKQLRELPIAAPVLGAQPERHTLKGAETNLYAEPAEQSFELTIAGRKVQVRVAPAEYRWSYGDGTALTTAAPGGPIPEARWGEKTATSHAYTATGDVTASLVTVFTGQFSVEGGPFQPIAGTATVPSAPRTLSVWRSEVRLYADDCNANPHGQGC